MSDAGVGTEGYNCERHLARIAQLGEAGLSLTHLTCVSAAERQTTDGLAGV